MQEVYDTTGTDSDSDNESTDGYSSEDSGWETEIEFETNVSKNNLIAYINANVSLEELFSRFYNIQFQEIYSPSGWTHKSNCPFPDHNDSTPSFGYNPKENRFFCFGCSRGGKSVNFVSWMDKISLHDAALKISSLLDVKDYQIKVNNKNSKEIDDLLLNFSSKIREFIKHNGNIKIAENLTWALDVYLSKHVPRSSIDFANLKARTDLLLKRVKNE